MPDEATNPGQELIWHLTGKALVGIISLGVGIAVAVGGWSLKMQMDSANQIRDLNSSVESLLKSVEKDREHNENERHDLEKRIIALEQWGPAHGPRVTTNDLDKRMETLMATYAQLYDQLVNTLEKLSETTNKQAELIARFDERIKRMEAKP
jgi:ABC-type transporter Mla subunit MlaD